MPTLEILEDASGRLDARNLDYTAYSLARVLRPVSNSKLSPVWLSGDFSVYDVEGLFELGGGYSGVSHNCCVSSNLLAPGS
jgi:hypothetical protein